MKLVIITKLIPVNVEWHNKNEKILKMLRGKRSYVKYDKPDYTTEKVGLHSTQSRSFKLQDSMQGEVHHICTAFRNIFDEPNKALVSVYIANLIAVALLDTGATCSITSNESLKVIKEKYPACLSVSEAGPSTINTIDGTERKRLKGKVNTSLVIQDHLVVPVTVFILNDV